MLGRLHQHIRQVPHLVRKDLYDGGPTPHQQPVLRDFKGQATGQPERVCLCDAVRTDNGLFYRHEVGLTRANEPVAVVAVLRLLGNEGGTVGGGGSGHGGGLIRVMVVQPLCDWMPLRQRASLCCHYNRRQPRNQAPNPTQGPRWILRPSRA
jgi:hypothetical protein